MKPGPTTLTSDIAAPPPVRELRGTGRWSGSGPRGPPVERRRPGDDHGGAGADHEPRRTGGAPPVAPPGASLRSADPTPYPPFAALGLAPAPRRAPAAGPPACAAAAAALRCTRPGARPRGGGGVGWSCCS